MDNASIWLLYPSSPSYIPTSPFIQDNLRRLSTVRWFLQMPSESFVSIPRRSDSFLSSAWFIATMVVAAVLCVCLAVAFVGTMATRRVRRTRRRATAVPQRRIDIELRPLPSVYLEIIPSPTELLGGPIPPSVEHIYESPYFWWSSTSSHFAIPLLCCCFFSNSIPLKCFLWHQPIQDICKYCT